MAKINESKKNKGDKIMKKFLTSNNMKRIGRIVTLSSAIIMAIYTNLNDFKTEDEEARFKSDVEERLSALEKDKFKEDHSNEQK